MALLIGIGICRLAFGSYLRLCGVRAVSFRPCCRNHSHRWDGRRVTGLPILRLAYQPVPTCVTFHAQGLLVLLQSLFSREPAGYPFLFFSKLAEQHYTAVSQALISFVLSMPILIRIFPCPLQNQTCSHMFKNYLKSSRNKYHDGLRASYLITTRASDTSFLSELPLDWTATARERNNLFTD
jgi:hypothetical protein